MPSPGRKRRAAPARARASTASTVSTAYVALLRGINVGGKNVIPMAALRAAFEALKLERVRSYIQSGNVLFQAGPADPGALTARIERALARAFGYEARIVLRSRAELDEVVARAPRGFGADPQERRYDVLFLRPPLTPAEALTAISLKEGVDEVAPGPGALYFSRLIARAAQSRLSRITGLPVYQHMTIRNWNTTTRLATMLAE